MLLIQIFQLVLLGVRVGCVTDWEQNNFGIRTEHHKDDLISKVNLDENAPKLIKTQKRQRHFRKSTKNHEKQKINFRVRGRGRDRSLGDIERPSILSRNPLRPQLIRDHPKPTSVITDNKVAASIKNKPSFVDFKENYLGISRAVSSVGEDEEIVSMQPATIGDKELQGPSKLRRMRLKTLTSPLPSPLPSSSSPTSERSPSVSSRRISVVRFKPRKKESGKKGLSHKVAGRTRMRRPPSVKTLQQRTPSSPSPVVKSIKRMRIRARERFNTTVHTQRPQPKKSQRKTLNRTSSSSFAPLSSSSSSLTLMSSLESLGLRPSAPSTTEMITISPDAHKIRFTLDSNEVTSQLPVLEDSPIAEKLVSKLLLPDDIFSQATQALMKEAAVEPGSLQQTFLPTLVPRKQKRGRFLLAAASNG